MKSALYLISLLLLMILSSSSCIKPRETDYLSISIDPPSLTITTNSAYFFPLTVKVNNTATDATEVYWTSGDSLSAVVNAKGWVLGTGAGGGQTHITATLKNGKGSAVCHVTVTDSNAYK